MLFCNMLPVNGITYLLLFLLTFCVVCPFPSVPLNQRNQDITWQVWLLVDDQNQQRISSDLTPRKRITPKSVFIAPTFRPEDLPACADGYTSDPLGRCIKIIKLDEDKHLDFLINKISDTFGNVDYEEEVEIEEMNDSSGPIQFSIPLSGGDGDYSNDSPQEESNIAIMFTPVEKIDKDKNEEILKLDKRAEDNSNNVELDMLNPTIIKNDSKKPLENSEEQRFDSTTIVENIPETTTIKEFTTTLADEHNDSTIVALQTEEFTTNVENVQDSTTLRENSEKFDKLVADFRDLTTTLEPNKDIFTDSYEITTVKNNDFDETTTGKEVETTNLEEFVTESTTRVDSKPESIKIIIDTNDYLTTDLVTDHIGATTDLPLITTEKNSLTTPQGASSTTPKITTYHPRSTRVTTYHPNLHVENKNHDFIRFPSEKSELRYYESTAEPRVELVKFPDINNQQESVKHHTRDVDSQFGNYVNDFVASKSKEDSLRRENNRFRFPDELHIPGRDLKHKADTDEHKMITNGQQYEYSMDRSTPKPLIRRNREKNNNFFGLPPDLMKLPPNRPSMSKEELSYVFGYRRTNRQTKSSKTHADRNR